MSFTCSVCSLPVGDMHCCRQCKKPVHIFCCDEVDEESTSARGVCLICLNARPTARSRQGDPSAKRICVLDLGSTPSIVPVSIVPSTSSATRKPPPSTCAPTHKPPPSTCAATHKPPPSTRAATHKPPPSTKAAIHKPPTTLLNSLSSSSVAAGLSNITPLATLQDPSQAALIPQANINLSEPAASTATGPVRRPATASFPSPSRSTSIVWKPENFSLEEVDTSTLSLKERKLWGAEKMKTIILSKCARCTQRFKYSRSTSTMRDHLRDAHQVLLNPEPAQDLKQPVAEIVVIGESAPQLAATFVSPSAQVNPYSLWIAAECLPARILTSLNFKRFIACIGARILPPSYKQHKTVFMPDTFRVVHDDVSRRLQSALSISLSIDLATVRGRAFGTVMATFVSDSFQFLTCNMSTNQFSGSITANVLTSYISDVLSNFQLDITKIAYISTDGGSNVKTCAQSFDRHIACSLHLLQLCVRACFANQELAASLLKQGKVIVNTIKDKKDLSETLTKVQQNLIAAGTFKPAGSRPLKLVQHVSTRWDSEFYMLERLLTLRDAISATLTSHSQSDMDFTANQKNLLEHLIPFLRHFEKCTRALSVSKNPTANLVLPEIHQLLIVCTESSSCDYIGAFANMMTEELKSRFAHIITEVSPFLFASLLDPRFKRLTFCDQTMVEAAHHSILQRLPASTTASTTRRYAFQTASGECTADNELTAYLNMVCDLGDNDDRGVLSWWRRRNSVLPTLSQLAALYLSVPSSECDSERSFSALNRILTARRDSLHSKTACELSFLLQNHDAVHLDGATSDSDEDDDDDKSSEVTFFCHSNMYQ
jgi:hypothetical protein